MKSISKKFDYTLNYTNVTNSFIPVLGHVAAHLFGYIYGWLYNATERELLVYDDGSKWWKESCASIARELHFSQSSILRAKNVLASFGLIKCKQEASVNRSLLWKIDEERLAIFSDFCAVLAFMDNPRKRNKLRGYVFYLQYPEIFDQFKDKVSGFDKYFADKELLEQARQAIAAGAKKEIPPLGGSEGLGHEEIGVKEDNVEDQARGNVATLGDRVKEKARENSPKKKPEKEMPHDEFVDYWNSKPHVPKIKYGCATYAKAAHILKLFRYKQLGMVADCPLSEDDREKFALDEIYRNDSETEYCGPKRKPRMTSARMYEILDMAAKVFDPEYTPSNTKYIAKLRSMGAANFFWCEAPDKNNSKNSIRYSPFLRHISIDQPRPLGQSEADSLYNSLDEEAQPLYDTIVYCLNVSRGRPRNKDLRLESEQKKVMHIVRQYWNFYQQNYDYMRSVLSIDRFEELIAKVERVGEDKACDWKDMPVSAFAKNGKIWEIVFDMDAYDTWIGDDDDGYDY